MFLVQTERFLAREVEIFSKLICKVLTGIPIQFFFLSASVLGQFSHPFQSNCKGTNSPELSKEQTSLNLTPCPENGAGKAASKKPGGLTQEP